MSCLPSVERLHLYVIDNVLSIIHQHPPYEPTHFLYQTLSTAITHSTNYKSACLIHQAETMI
jgi:hypothetical protein